MRENSRVAGDHDGALATIPQQRPAQSLAAWIEVLLDAVHLIHRFRGMGDYMELVDRAASIAAEAVAETVLGVTLQLGVVSSSCHGQGEHCTDDNGVAYP
jgi:hypothetical protein